MMTSQLAEPRLLHFSTDRLPEAERIAVWRELYGQTILRLDIEPLPDRPFKADMRLRALNGLRLTSGTISGTCDRRTSILMADGNDDLGLAINWGGPSTVSQCGREAMLNDGDAILLSCGDAGMLMRPAPCRYVGLRVPRAALSGLAPNCEDMIGVPIARSNGTLELLTSYAAALLSDEHEPTLEFGHVAASHVYDLIALLLGATADAAAAAEGRGARAARLRVIKDDIAGRLHSRELTITALAARHGVTPRYVQRLFEDEGTSFTGFLLGQRLALARRLLSDPRRAEATISAIALDCGFNDLSYFNRTFRRRFSATPSDVRNAALRDRRASTALSTPPNRA